MAMIWDLGLTLILNSILNIWLATYTARASVRQQKVPRLAPNALRRDDAGVWKVYRTLFPLSRSLFLRSILCGIIGGLIWLFFVICLVEIGCSARDISPCRFEPDGYKWLKSVCAGACVMTLYPVVLISAAMLDVNDDYAQVAEDSTTSTV
jgi:uncharacterized membrane protein